LSRFDAEVSATRLRMQSVAALLTAVVASQPHNHPGHPDQKSHAGGRGAGGFDDVDQFGNATLDGQVYNDQDLSTGTRLTPEYLDQFGRPAHETFYGDSGKGFSVVLSERGEFHIAADRADKTPRPGLDKRDQGLGNVRGPEDVVASGISRDGLASLASDARSASAMDASEGSRTNVATGITVTSRNGGDNVSLSLNGRSLGDVAGYVDELEASVAAFDEGAHRR
jgi:hypothetical protein